MSGASQVNRILVVDDDPMLGRLLLRYLSRAGIDADAVASVAEASSSFLPGVHTHAVVDLTLPDGSGAEWLAAALTEDADLVGILTSGYPISTDLFPEAFGSRVRALQKPFSPPDLLRALGTSAPD